MTPPVRPSWAEPDAHTFTDALAMARVQAASWAEPITISAEITEGVLGFMVYIGEVPSSSGHTTVAVVTPDGAVDVLAAALTV